jgi:microcystin-dependent protein
MSFYQSAQPIVIPDPTVANPGVTSVTAGSNIFMTGTPTQPVVNAYATVASIIAGTNITVSGTSNITINATAEGVAPTGTMVLNAAVNPPAGWLNCDGSSYPNATYPALFDAIGYRYSAGFGGPTFSATGGLYTITDNVITIPITMPVGVPSYNHQIIPGSLVLLTGFEAATGNEVNDLYATIDSCPPIGNVGSATPYVATFLIAQENGTGSQSAAALQRLTIASFQVPDTIGRTIRGTSGVDPDYTLANVGGADTVTLAADNLPSHAHNTPGTGQGMVPFNSGGVGFGGSGNIEGTTATQYTGAEVLTPAFEVATAAGDAGIPVEIRNSYIAITYIIKT